MKTPTAFLKPPWRVLVGGTVKLQTIKQSLVAPRIFLFSFCLHAGSMRLANGDTATGVDVFRRLQTQQCSPLLLTVFVRQDCWQFTASLLHSAHRDNTGP